MSGVWAIDDCGGARARAAFACRLAASRHGGRCGRIQYKGHPYNRPPYGPATGCLGRRGPEGAATTRVLDQDEAPEGEYRFVADGIDVGIVGVAGRGPQGRSQVLGAAYPTWQFVGESTQRSESVGQFGLDRDALRRGQGPKGDRLAGEVAVPVYGLAVRAGHRQGQD